MYHEQRLCATLPYIIAEDGPGASAPRALSGSVRLWPELAYHLYVAPIGYHQLGVTCIAYVAGTSPAAISIGE